MEEDSSSDDDDDEEESATIGGAKAPTPMGKPVMAVDAAPAVNQPPPSLPTPGNVEVIVA